MALSRVVVVVVVALGQAIAKSARDARAPGGPTPFITAPKPGLRWNLGTVRLRFSVD
jgi:hypothetical protein